MFNKTKINSQGEKKRRFHMPKFPSALVILFIVLVFVVVLSWIPHKGWVDTGNASISFDEMGIFAKEGLTGPIYLGMWTNVDAWNSGDVTDLSVTLTNDGVKALTALLTNLGFDDALVSSIVGEGTNPILISNIKKADDWNKVAINYSSVTFTATMGTYSIDLNIDKIFATGAPVIKDGVIEEGSAFGFNILSGSVVSYTADDVVTKLEAPLAFAPASGKGNYFNFWNTNYYMADVNGRYGLLNIPFIILAGVFNAAGVILYLLCIGAFIEIMLQSGALEAGTSSLVKKLGGKELFLIPILFILFCTGGTTYGMQEETLGLIPLIVPFLVLAGFDTMTGLLVVVVGTTMGIGSSVVNPFSVGVMSGALQTEGAMAEEIEVAIATGIVIRIIEFLVFCVVGSTFCTWYGWRSRKGAKYCAEPDLYEANKEWAQNMLGDAHASSTGLTKRQAWGLGIFAGTFALMIFALLPWTSWTSVGSNEQGFWFIVSSFLYSSRVLGEWYFVQLGMLFLATSFILGRVFGMDQKNTNKAVVDGAKSMIGVSMILMMSRAIGLVLSYSGLATGMIALLFHGGGGGGQFSAAGLAWILLPILALLAVFIPSTSGLAGITGPIIAPIIWTMGGTTNYLGYAAIVMATYPLAQGIINMFMPTTGLVVAQAEVAKVNFGKAMPILMGCAAATALIGMTIISLAAPIYMH